MRPTLKTSSGTIAISVVEGLGTVTCSDLLAISRGMSTTDDVLQFTFPWNRGTGVPSEILKRCAEILENIKDGKPIERLGSTRTAAMDQIYKVPLLLVVLFLCIRDIVQGLKTSPSRSSFMYLNIPNPSKLLFEYPFEKWRAVEDFRQILIPKEIPWDLKQLESLKVRDTVCVAART